MLKFWRPSSCILYLPYSTFKLSALRLSIRGQSFRRYNSSESSETIKSTTAIKPKGPRRRHVISTLDPSRLQDSDFLDLSNGVMSARLTACIPTILKPPASSSPPQNLRFPIQIYYHGETRLRRLFPVHARGFLYYYHDPKLPPISGAVRFRLMPDSCTTTSGFGAGTDLMLPSGRGPWAIWLLPIASAARYIGLKQLLLSDGLVTCRNLSASPRTFYSLTQMYPHILFRLEQPFVIDLATSVRLSVMEPQGIEKAQLRFISVLRPEHHKRAPFFPYSGQCMVRFECSLAPEHAGKRVAVIRVLEILTPIKITDPTFIPGNKRDLFHMPTVGSLLVKGDHPIAINADACVHDNPSRVSTSAAGRHIRRQTNQPFPPPRR
ncbi:hypothetical protein Hypma_000037 [Hypsizygus marmoreus]|uniref:Uncharacterized protein n=1 Tax=Hypsizygus marmoreus TaxID=39966 RepID=A0A369KH53_HYPMA|nr:hypothetical protein Hypma_000037 [Hypsizygus marmoreus]